MLRAFLIFTIISTCSSFQDQGPEVLEPQEYGYHRRAYIRDPFEFKLGMECNLKRIFRWKIKWIEHGFFKYEVFGTWITNEVGGHSYHDSKYIYTGMLYGGAGNHRGYDIAAVIQHDCNYEDRMVELQVMFYPLCQQGKDEQPLACRRQAVIVIDNLEGYVEADARVLRTRGPVDTDGYSYIV